MQLVGGEDESISSPLGWAEGALESLCSDLSLSRLQKPRAGGNLLEFPQQIREELGWEFWTPDPSQGSSLTIPPPIASLPWHPLSSHSHLLTDPRSSNAASKPLSGDCCVQVRHMHHVPDPRVPALRPPPTLGRPEFASLPQCFCTLYSAYLCAESIFAI